MKNDKQENPALNAQAITQLQDALKNNVRAFRHRQSGEVRYVISGPEGRDELDDYESVMIIPDLDNEAIDAILAINPPPHRKA